MPKLFLPSPHGEIARPTIGLGLASQAHRSVHQMNYPSKKNQMNYIPLYINYYSLGYLQKLVILFIIHEKISNHDNVHVYVYKRKESLTIYYKQIFELAM